MLTDYEIELVTSSQPQRPPCRFCGSDLCTGVVCGGLAEEQILEDRRQRQHEKNLEQLDALAVERREIELIRQLRNEELEKVEQEIAEKTAEYENNLALLDAARAAGLSDALARAGAPGLEAAAPDAVACSAPDKIDIAAVPLVTV